MRQKFLRKLLLSLTLLSTSLYSISGISLNNQANKNIPSNNESYNEPDIDKEEEKKNYLSETINTLSSAKEIKFSSFKVTIYLNETSADEILYLDFSSLDIDLSSLNSLSISLSSNLKLTYKEIEESFSLAIENQKLYITNRGNAFSFDMPKNLSDVLKLLKTFNININLSSATESVSLSSIKKIIDNLSVISSTPNTENNEFSYLLNSEDIIIDETTISGLNFILNSDSNNTPYSLKSSDKLEIKTKSSTIGISLQGSISAINDVSTYQQKGNSSFIDMTENNSSLINTLIKLFTGGYSSNSDENGEALNQVNLNLSAEIQTKNQNDYITTSKLNGDIKADLSKVFMDDNYGEYELNIIHNNSNSTLNEIYAYYNKETTYLSLNSLFKGRIENSQLSDLFSNISQITSMPVISEIDDDLNLVLKTTDTSTINKLLNGDLSAVNDIFTSYAVSSNSLSLTLNGKSLGLDSESITISLNFASGLLKNLVIDNITISTVTLKNITLSLNNFVDIVKPNENEYPNYSPSISLFNNVATLLDKKKVKANYSLIYTDKNNVTFNASGIIGADLTNIKTTTIDDKTYVPLDSGDYYLSFELPSDKNDPTTFIGQGIEACYKSNDKNLYFGYNYYQNDNYEILKDSSHFVFKNSVSSTDITDMLHYIDKKVDDTSSETSSSIADMSNFINTIVNSSKYESIKNNLTSNLSLKGLDSVIEISTNDNGDLNITLDPSEFLTGTSYDSTTDDIKLTFNSENELTNLSLTGKINSRYITFNLSLSDGEFDSSKFNTTDYPLISHGEEMLESFVSLPTDLKQFDIGVTGSVVKNNSSTPLVSIQDGSGASVDLTSSLDYASGVLLLRHPDLNDTTKSIDFDQKLEFMYQESSELVTNSSNKETNNGDVNIEYNDNMHIKMQNSDVFSIMSTIKSVDDESNLLYRYLKFLNSTVQSSGSPIMDLMNGKELSTTGIFAYPYINSITFNSDNVVLSINPKILMSSCDDKSNCDITIGFDLTTKHITSASIDCTYISDETTYDIDASISLETGTNKKYERQTSDSSKDNYILDYSSSNSSKFIDVNSISILLQCGVDTTENNFMEIEGIFYLKVGGIGTAISWFGGDTKLYTKCYAAIYIEDETVYCYLRFATSTDSTFPTIKEKGYRVTEFFIKEDEVLVNQTKTDQSSYWSLFKNYYTYTTSYESYKTTGKNVTDNIAYYILDYIMDLGRITGGETALNSIYDSMNSTSDSSTTIKNDFSKVINEFSYSNNQFYVDLNLSSILSIPMVSISKLNMTITHDSSSTSKALKSIALNAKVTVASVLTVEISSSSTYNTFALTKLKNITASDAKTTYMTRYYNFSNNFYSDNGEYSDESKCQMYLINKVASKGNPTYTGTLLTKSYSKSNSKGNDKTYNVTGWENDYHFYSW